MKHISFFAMSLLLSGCLISQKKIESKPDPWLNKQLEKSNDQDIIIALLQEMGIRRSTPFLPQIIKYTTHPIAKIRKNAIETLIAYGPAYVDSRRDQAYLDSLSDKDISVSNTAKEAISQRLQSEIETTFITNALLDRLQKSKNWKEQLQIIELVQWIDSEKNIRILMRFASQHSNPQVRILAIQALGQLRVADARSLFFELQHKDLDPDVREAAKLSLKQVGGKLHDVVLAVMPFELQGIEKKQAKGLENYLSGALSSAEIGTVVERGQVDKIMTELIYQDQFIDDNKAIEIGKSLRASQVVTGNIQVTDNHCTITIKRIDVSSQEILNSAQISGLLIDLDALQRQVTQEFIARF